MLSVARAGWSSLVHACQRGLDVRNRVEGSRACDWGRDGWPVCRRPSPGRKLRRATRPRSSLELKSSQGDDLDPGQGLVAHSCGAVVSGLEYDDWRATNDNLACWL